jgi:hypothetical protein
MRPLLLALAVLLSACDSPTQPEPPRLPIPEPLDVRPFPMDTVRPA